MGVKPAIGRVLSGYKEHTVTITEVASQGGTNMYLSSLYTMLLALTHMLMIESEKQ